MEPQTTPPEVGTPVATWRPSRKWLAAQTTLLTGLGITVVDSGWGAEQWKAFIGIVSAALISYLLPNAES